MNLFNKLKTTLTQPVMYLGTFGTSNQPAIAWESSSYESNIRGSGLLCVVPVYPNKPPIKLLGGRVLYNDIYKVKLINYATTTSSSYLLMQAVDLLVTTFDCTDWVHKTADDDFVEQVYLDLYYPMLSE